MKLDYTATVYIFHESKVLLLLHSKTGKWVPPGGHIEAHETPSLAAIREVKEETGLDIQFINQEHLWIEKESAKSFHRPFMCLLENVPAWKEQEAHQHADFIYLAKPIGSPIVNTKEAHIIRWFNFKEIKTLNPNIDIYPDMLDTLQYIFDSKLVSIN